MKKIKTLNKLDIALLISLIIYPLTTPYGIGILDIILSWLITELIMYGFLINIIAGAIILIWICFTLQNKFKVNIPPTPKDNPHARKH